MHVNSLFMKKGRFSREERKADGERSIVGRPDMYYSAGRAKIARFDKE